MDLTSIIIENKISTNGTSTREPYLANTESASFIHTYFILLDASFEAGIIHSLGTLNLTDIDHVSIKIYSVSPTLKRGGITGQSDPQQASVDGNLTPPDPYIGFIDSKTRRYKETHTQQARQSHLMRVT